MKSHELFCDQCIRNKTQCTGTLKEIRGKLLIKYTIALVYHDILLQIKSQIFKDVDCKEYLKKLCFNIEENEPTIFSLRFGILRVLHRLIFNNVKKTVFLFTHTYPSTLSYKLHLYHVPCVINKSITTY